MNFKRFWPYARRGLLIGMAIQILLLWINTADHRIATEITLWLAASVIYGVSCVLFDLERLSLLAATVIHCLLCYGITVTVCLVLGYGETWGQCALECLPLFLILYVLIFVGTSISIRIQMKKINKKLQS